MSDDDPIISVIEPPVDARPETGIVDAAMHLAGTKPWLSLRMSEIAAAAGVPLGTLYRIYPSKHAILTAAMRAVDLAMLEQIPDPADSPRDRIFEILMRRFDALQHFRPALTFNSERLRKGRGDALLLLPAALLNLGHAMRWVLEASGERVTGFRGAIRLQIVTAAYLAALRTWARDESEDLSATMAALDRALRRLDVCRSDPPAKKDASAGSGDETSAAL